MMGALPRRGRCGRWRSSVAACALFLLAGDAAGDITLRTGERIVDPIELVSIEGITVRGTSARLIGWESIEVVRGPRAGDASHFMPMAERAWRARIRLSRGDLELARPLLEGLFAELRGREGSVALLVSEGLLRCRLAAADVPGAVPPWIESVRLRDLGTAIRGNEQEPELLHRATLLCPALPPFFTPDQGDALLESLGMDPPVLPESGPARALLGWYTLAARHDGTGSSGRSAGGPGAEDEQHPGARFVGDLVTARTAGDPQARALARNRLRIGLEGDLNTWREAWRRAGLGMSHLAEGDDQNTLIGVLELLHLPARFGTTQPQLAGFALAHASAALDRLGYSDSGDRLRREFRASHPGHPALRMLPADRKDSVDDAETDDPLERSGETMIP